MFARIFAAMVGSVVAASWAFGLIFSGFQDQAGADALAPLWAAALQAASRPDDGLSSRLVSIPVEVLRGEPPPGSIDLSGDARMKKIAAALRRHSVDVRQIRLDDSVEPAVTWLDAAGSDGVARWAGIPGGMQPSSYRRRLALALASMLLIVLSVAALLSGWLARPLQQLAGRIDAFARGERPASRVHGAREIESLDSALRAMAERRFADDERMRAMLLGVSHDLRSPLARLRVAADLLNDGSEGLRDLMIRNIEQADAIIESFLTFVRAEAEALDEQVDIAHIARAAAELAQLSPGQVEAAGPIIVRGHGVLLQRAIANLLDNAQRHGAPPIQLKVAVEPAGGQVAVSVSDAGRGIAEPDRLRRAFERGDAARGQPGSGLGLAIVDRIAQSHGGQMAIERSESGGARVVLRMALDDGRPDGDAPPARR